MPAGKVMVQGRITKTHKGGAKEVLHQEVSQSEAIQPTIEFPPNAPRVGAKIGMTIAESGTYCSIHAEAWCELPVPGFGKDIFARTHERAFEICEDKVVEKMAGLKDILRSL